MGPNLMSLREQQFFETFVSINFLGPKEMILPFAQTLSKNLVDPYKLFPNVYPAR